MDTLASILEWVEWVIVNIPIIGTYLATGIEWIISMFG